MGIVQKPAVYFAGPQVFHKDAKSWFTYVSDLTAYFGFHPLLPWNLSPEKNPTSQEIYEQNADLIRRADAVVAHLKPFRGTEPDSGTVWEAGFAYGLGKPVVGVVEDSVAPIKWRTHAYFRSLGFDSARIASTHYMPDQMCVEDFDYKLNLMLQHSCSAVVATAAQALVVVEGELARRKTVEVLAKL